MSKGTRVAFVLLLCMGLGAGASRAETPPAPAEVETLPLFAVEVRVGPKWDPSKKPHEQALFREHSANLKVLREAGHLVVGARYSDVGLVILAAESEEAARAMIDADPSIAAGTFTYRIHPFNVFYPGTLRSPVRATGK
jgi:uncharacterized protein YciI